MFILDSVQTLKLCIYIGIILHRSHFKYFLIIKPFRKSQKLESVRDAYFRYMEPQRLLFKLPMLSYFNTVCKIKIILLKYKQARFDNRPSQFRL